MGDRLTIDERYRGFPTVALGGYACGLIADRLDGSTEVRLRKPVPMGVELDLESGDGKAILRHGEDVLGEGAEIELEISVPEPPSYREAATASRNYPGFNSHAFPECFGCGPTREEGDGLRMFPGRLESREVLAATWLPPPTLAGADGAVRPELVWSAVDCPQLWALMLAARGDEQVVTGAMAGRLLGPVQADEPHIVLSWPLERDGRKLYAGAAVLSRSGEVKAISRQTSLLVEQGVPLRASWEQS
jgi:hypothetical protein